jgi:hypothetical protein
MTGAAKSHPIPMISGRWSFMVGKQACAKENPPGRQKLQIICTGGEKPCRPEREALRGWSFELMVDA